LHTANSTQKDSDLLVIEINNRTLRVGEKMLPFSRIIAAHISHIPSAANVISFEDANAANFRQQAIFRHETKSLRKLALENTSGASVNGDDGSFHIGV